MSNIRYLSLFSGAAGGDLGLQHLLDWECAGYVEWDKYCCRVLEQRIKDGFLSDAPIFCGDIREWIRLGYAAAYQGMVDAVAGGFPCQPFSEAGLQIGADDPRNMWPAMRDAICIIRPRYCILENVSNLLAHKYFGAILGELARLGYDVRWGVLSACSFDAPHTRERVFAVAYTSEQGRKVREQRGRQQRQEDRHQKWNLHHWFSQSEPIRVAPGLANRVERIAATGNGQLPVMAASAWRLLAGGNA